MSHILLHLLLLVRNIQDSQHCSETLHLYYLAYELKDNSGYFHFSSHLCHDECVCCWVGANRWTQRAIEEHAFNTQWYLPRCMWVPSPGSLWAFMRSLEKWTTLNQLSVWSQPLYGAGVFWDILSNAGSQTKSVTFILQSHDFKCGETISTAFQIIVYLTVYINTFLVH